MAKGKRKTLTKEAQKNIIKTHERLTVAKLHEAGNLIRATEVKRFQMIALPLLGRAEGLLYSADYASSLPKLSDTFSQLASALGNKKTGDIVGSIGRGFEDISMATSFVNGVASITVDVNRLLQELQRKGIYFDFVKFPTSHPSMEFAAVVLCQSIGFLKGITRVKPEMFQLPE